MTNRSAIARRPASLASRVTLSMGVAMAAAFLMFNWVSVRSLDQHFVEMDEHVLWGVFDAVIRALGEVHSEGDDEALQNAIRGHEGVYYYVADAVGNTLYSPAEGPDLAGFAASQRPAALTDEPRVMASWSEDGSSYRGAVVWVDSDPAIGPEAYLVAVAMDIDGHLQFLSSFKRIQWWTLCIVMCIAILVAWFAVKWGHIPIRKANEKVREITSSKLHMRLNPEEVPIELEETVASFNGMLERIEDGFAQLENFSADIAHELRTPVTNLTTQTEVVVGQVRSTDEYREVLYSNLEEFGRLNRMINDMLFLAQTDNDPDNLNLEIVNLTETIQGLFEYFEAWVEEQGVSLQLKGRAVPVRADREMLRRALSNLLSNAIRYTPHGETVTVRLSQNEQATTISVENPGEKIPAEELPRLFNRFYRGDPSRQRKGDGAGLGLAIVKSIVEVHGGKVRVESDDTLTRFDVMLPRAM